MRNPNRYTDNVITILYELLVLNDVCVGNGLWRELVRGFAFYFGGMWIPNLS